MINGHEGILVYAADADGLRQALAGVDTTVPLRTEGRTTIHTERYSMTFLLSTLPSSRWRFPMTVVHGDRPDFMIQDGSGRRIAVECVEAVPENEAKKQALRERSEGAGPHFLSRATPGEKPRSTRQLLREIQDNDGGDGWVGDSVEREWANAMAHVALGKSASVLKEGYDRGDEAWLLVYDAWPLPHPNPKKAAEHLMRDHRRSSIFASFERVFVLDSAGVWEITAVDWHYHPLRRPSAASVEAGSEPVRLRR